MTYEEFASKISFFEFIQEEYYKPDFIKNNFLAELEAIKKDLTIDGLTKDLEKYPKVIDIFEEFFQQSRFSNVQLINFLFDVSILNSLDYDIINNHARTSIFNFENNKTNDTFNSIYNAYSENDKNKDKIILDIKRSIVKYVDICQKKREVFYLHIQSSIGSRLRISRYLIENLWADKILKTIDLDNYLSLKRRPIDNKKIHGDFGVIKISNILKLAGIPFIDYIKSIDINLGITTEIQTDFCYSTETRIEQILKRTDRRPKVFDFVIYYQGKPKVVIETNFYSTSGTKIGINENEYVALNEDIKTVNLSNNNKIIFMWITDGNFWLTHEGEKKFRNLKLNHFKEEITLQNYNTFKILLPKLQNKLHE